MLSSINHSKSETLEKRLAKRRGLRDRQLSDKNSPVDETSNVSTHQSFSKTQSIDCTNRLNILSTDSSTTSTMISNQGGLSSISTQNSVLPNVKSLSIATDLYSSSFKTSYTPFLQQMSKSQPFDDHNGRKASSTLLSPSEKHHENESHQKLRPLMDQEISSSATQSSINLISAQQLNSMEPKTSLPSAPDDNNEKSNINNENVASILPSIISSKIIKSSNLKLDEINKNSMSNQSKSYSCASQDRSFRHTSTNNSPQQPHFNFMSFSSSSIPSTTSEHIASLAKRINQSIDSKFAKHNSLALSYLFNQRTIDVKLAHLSSLEDKQSQQRTVWE